MRYLGFLLLAVATHFSTAWGAISPIVLSGDNVPGLTGAQFATFALPSANSAGAGVFQATLELGPGGVSSNDDSVVTHFDTNGLTLLARENSGDVPGIASGNYQSFSAVAIDNQGNVLLRGALTRAGSVTSDNDQGIWHYSTNPALLARTGSLGVPGKPNASFETLPIDALRLSANGHSVVSTDLIFGGGISVDNDRGLWHFVNTTGTLVIQEATHNAVGTQNLTFTNFVGPAINDNDEIAFNGFLTLGSEVTASNRPGIWKYSGTSATGVLLARAGMSNAPGLTNQSFKSFSPPVINNTGQVAFNATATSSELSGIWLYTNNSGQLKAFVNSGGVVGVPDANFAAFRNVLLSDSGDLLFAATLETGPGSVDSNNNKGLWMMNQAGDDRLLLRAGSGGVPGIPAANFREFDTYAINESGVVVLAASLEIGPGNVAADTDIGLWLIDPNGESSLIAREGDSLAGRTIAELHFMGDSGGSDGHSTGFNQFKQLLFQATFTDGDQGIFLYSPENTDVFSAADFNLDGHVDETDLSWWSGAYGSSDAGDADGDGDSDGADFLIWQREYTGPAASTEALVVPEPSVCWLLLLACGLSQHRRPLCRHRKF